MFSRVTHILHFTSQDLDKNTSLGGGLPVLQIKIPFGIHKGEEYAVNLFLFPL